MKSRVLSVVSQGWFAVVTGFLLFNVAAANAQVPTIASIAPSSRAAGGPAFTLTVTGTNYNSSSIVRWNGSDRVTSQSPAGSTTTLEAAITAMDIATAGTAQVTVFNPGPAGGQTSTVVTFTITGVAPTAPTIASLAPGSAAAGGQAFKLTVTGTNYNMSSVVRWNGSDRVTNLLNPMSTTTLEAAITALDIIAPGTAQVTVVNAGGQTSNAATFIITGEAPTVTSISPSTAVAGGPAFTLTVTGTNFNSTSIVQWNGTNRTTTFVEATRLTAAIPAPDIAQPGTATVRVTTGTANSNSVNFTVTQFSSLYFPQVVTGGGYSTHLAFNNLGSSTATGNLILTDSLGSPFVVSLNETPVSFQPSEEPVNIDGSSFGVSVPAGGARVFLATSLNPLQLRTGWGRFESTSAGVVGLSTFLLSEGLTLRSVAGVFATQPVEFATIGVDNSLSQGRFTGFSIANPTNENINIRVVVLNAEGNITETLTPPELNPLGPQRQVSKFLHEYLPVRATFRGSVVLAAQAGRRFVATALIQFQGLLTATPVTPDKPAAVTN
jgi:hypothetical protein